MKSMDQTGKRRMEGKNVYVGVDVHKESWQVTIRSDGEEIINCRIPGQYPPLKKLLDRYQGCRIKVAYEAGPFGFWLSDKLTGDGIETLVVPPSLIPTESGNRVKTDKKDSRKLAKLLEGNMCRLYKNYTVWEEVDNEYCPESLGNKECRGPESNQ